MIIIADADVYACIYVAILCSPGGIANTLSLINSQGNNGSVCVDDTVTGALLVGENSCGISQNVNNTINAIALGNRGIRVKNDICKS